MPTGYTHQLAERNFNVRAWLLNDLIRGMGIAIMFRDDGHLDLETMEQKLQEYVQVEQVSVDKAIAEQAETIAKMHLMTQAEWQTEYDQQTKANEEAHACRLAEYHVGHAAHQKALDQLRTMQPKAKSEVGVGLLKFAVEQVQTGMGFDYGSKPDPVEIPLSLREYIKLTQEHSIRVAANCVGYATKARASAQSRATGFRDVVLEINKLCDEQELP